MAAMQAASSNVPGSGMQAMMQAGLAAGGGERATGHGDLNGGPAVRDVGMAEVYQAAYAAAAQQQRLRSFSACRRRLGLTSINQAALAAAAAGLLSQPLSPARCSSSASPSAARAAWTAASA